MKPSVPKVVITTDKPKPPVIIMKSKEGISTKQEQVRITHQKVNSTVITMFGFSSSLLYKPYVFLKKILMIHFSAHFFPEIYSTYKHLATALIQLYYSSSTFLS